MSALLRDPGGRRGRLSSPHETPVGRVEVGDTAEGAKSVARGLVPARGASRKHAEGGPLGIPNYTQQGVVMGSC